MSRTKIVIEKLRDAASDACRASQLAYEACVKARKEFEKAHAEAEDAVADYRAAVEENGHS